MNRVAVTREAARRELCEFVAGAQIARSDLLRAAGLTVLKDPPMGHFQ